MLKNVTLTPASLRHPETGLVESVTTANTTPKAETVNTALKASTKIPPLLMTPMFANVSVYCVLLLFNNIFLILFSMQLVIVNLRVRSMTVFAMDTQMKRRKLWLVNVIVKTTWEVPGVISVKTDIGILRQKILQDAKVCMSKSRPPNFFLNLVFIYPKTCRMQL